MVEIYVVFLIKTTLKGWKNKEAYLLPVGFFVAVLWVIIEIVTQGKRDYPLYCLFLIEIQALCCVAEKRTIQKYKHNYPIRQSENDDSITDIKT